MMRICNIFKGLGASLDFRSFFDSKIMRMGRSLTFYSVFFFKFRTVIHHLMINMRWGHVFINSKFGIRACSALFTQTLYCVFHYFNKSGSWIKNINADITEKQTPHKTNINLIDIKVRVVNHARIIISLTSRKWSTFNCEMEKGEHN